MSTKASLRRRFESQRSALTTAERRDRTHSAWSLFLTSTLLIPGQSIALYAAIGSEMGTEGLVQILQDRGMRILFPRCQKETKKLDFVEVQKYGDLRPGAYGILEPTGPSTSILEVDQIVLPGLAFDYNGGRLGYGGGFYDRILADYKGRMIGLAFDFQVIQQLPICAHDRHVHVVVTDAQIVRTPYWET